MRIISCMAGMLCLLAGLSACAPTTSGGLQSAFSPMQAGPDFAPREPSRPELSGYIAEGPGFTAELMFDEAPDGGVEIDSLIDTGAALIWQPRLAMAEPWLADGVQRYEGRIDRIGEIALILEAGPCAIGDVRYGHFATLDMGGRLHEGCARETGPHPLWTREIGEFLPAVNACLADDDAPAGNGQRVSLAYHRGGSAVVRFDVQGGGRFDCEYDASGISWQTVSDQEPRQPGEGNPYFIPGRLPQDGEGCFLYESVRDAQGRTIGALAHDGCTVTPVG
ncbi:MAG: lipoprotein [Oceanicaulis sp. HLUCCA04]|nr:MAG: lipoprotein [Oceanicaulis sp. HLUCCA04]